MSGLQDAWTAASPKPEKRKRKPPPLISIRFSEKERARLDRDAGTLSLAAYIRLKLFDGIDPPPTKRKRTRKRYTPSAELAVIAEMLVGLGQSRLASNMNQLAKAANTGTLDLSHEVIDELWDACKAIVDMRETLISALGLKSEVSR